VSFFLRRNTENHCTLFPSFLPSFLPPKNIDVVINLLQLILAHPATDHELQEGGHEWIYESDSPDFS